ncbi:MAG: type II toxin-antitoxin system Phd/YefM family antitoxin [Chloroflexi bacterium]|nr:type II toxin-antitoxin system Phd/YefM family antitoxin [Chloroflexota bacterium]
MERELGVTKARQVFGTMVEQVQYRGDTYIINRHGKPAAAVVPMQVYETWKCQRQDLFDQIRKMQREANLDNDEAESLAAEAVAAVRA